MNAQITQPKTQLLEIAIWKFNFCELEKYWACSTVAMSPAKIQGFHNNFIISSEWN